MGKVYCIGKFQFDSYEEYQEALDDIEKIRYMSKKMDINEPGVAQRLYTLIREDKIIFKSVIGDDYLLYLSDLVAEDYRTMSKNPFGKRVAKKVHGISFSQVLGAVCMAGAVVCFLIFLGSEYRDQQKTRELEQLKDDREISAASDWLSSKLMDVLKDEDEAETVTAESETVDNEVYAAELTDQEEPEAEGPSVLPRYQELYQQNSDLAGWITIPGTKIDYPVMQAVSESSDFYLDHNYDGAKDINGSIFLDSRNNVEHPNDNMVIYGHNMKSGMMFGGLKEYLDKKYWQEHKFITFHTIYEEAEYEIMAVCLSKVEEENDSFKYYDFIDAGNKKAFKRYVKNIKALNIMDEDLDISYGDKLLTLSTCNNYTKDGRLFLVAKKCEK